MRRAAENRGVSGQIDGIGNDGGGSVGLGRGPRQHGDGVGNAERKTASVAPAGANPARRIVGTDDHGPHQTRRIRPVREAHGKMFSVRKMQRDVAAIIDVGALKWRCPQHRAENLFGDCACDRRHRGDEAIGGKWRHSFMHAAHDRALQQASPGIGRLAQQRQLLAELIEQACKTPRRGVIGRTHVYLAAAGLHDQVDWTVLQMKPPAVSQKPDLRSSRHARCPRGDGCDGI